MRVPLEWLHEFCAPALAAPDLAERLAMTGTAVERLAHHGVMGQEHFLVGRVLSAEPHPDADRLRVCTVDLGRPTPSQIVCGAPNVAAGQTVAVATPGAIMPDGTELGSATLRGVRSEGMILAEDELGIGTDPAGILVLDHGGLVPGSLLSSVLPISSDVFELEITPNRPDCLSIYGVAREAHAATGAPLAPAPWSSDPGQGGPSSIAGIEIEIEVPELCPRFTARVFEDVAVGPSPLWLKSRLMAAGQRPISNVVDITNYVMLLTGQPMHAFDLDRVAGGRLIVRSAQAGELVTTLDGQTRELDVEMVVIDDAEGPTSIAGVMGGDRSEVSESTTRVLLEAATWDGPNIHRTAKRLGLRSEASSRFEKQTQPEQAIWAQAIAARLMTELTGAQLVSGTIDLGAPPPAGAVIEVRDARVSGLLGVAVPRARSSEILGALGFGVQETELGLAATVPPWRRGDITREADLIEEIARIGALEDLPATLPSRRGATGRLTRRQRLRRRAADALASRGVHEIVGWSFTAPEVASRLRVSPEDHHPVELRNPMSGEQSVLRESLLPSLLDAARHNRSHGATAVRLFESGPVYLARGDGAAPHEPHRLAVLLAGPVRPATWREPSPPEADVFAAKGLLESVLGALKVTFEVEAASEPFLHPGRCGAVTAAEALIGWVGEIHPLVAETWELESPLAAFEIDLDTVAGLAPDLSVYAERTAFPAVREDLALIVADGVAAADVLGVVREAGAPLLQAGEIFDVYRDEQRIGKGRVSLAVRLTFAATDRTLRDEEVAERREAIAAALLERLDARVRRG